MSDSSDPSAAEQAFYDAFVDGDFDRMMSVWAPDDDIVCIHPLGPRLENRADVAASWRQILADKAPRQFELHVKSRWQSDTLAVHIVDELISIRGSDAQFRPVIATNIYRLLEDGSWYIVAHHASIDASEERLEVDQQSSATRH